MNLINKCLYNRRRRQLKLHLEEFKLGKSENYLSDKLSETKDGIPICLIHCYTLENGQISAGNICVLTPKGLDGSLKYLVGSYEDKYIKIGDIGHASLNQGIGTQMLIFLDEIAREIKAREITGWLSPVHLDNHGDRLIYFLKKNRYKIISEKTPNLYAKGLFVTKYLKA